MLIILILFVGYYLNMWHLAFNSLRPNEEFDMSIEKVSDIFLAIDICLKFVTAYQRDVEWETNIWMIIKNYLRHNFVFDLTATLPGLITD